ncbi:MAG: hypothetical protein PHH35_00230 [Candidatus Pacebacteria bacterium]|nr:hypothetical protein [Candidatus Paceibacterota bacterium]
MPEDFNLNQNNYPQNYPKKEDEGIPNLQTSPDSGASQFPQQPYEPLAGGQTDSFQQQTPNQFAATEQPFGQMPSEPLGQQQPASLEESLAKEPEPKFTPPPSNVFIRTSESDLERIKAEGGTMPGIEPDIAPPSFSPDIPGAGFQEMPEGPVSAPKKSNLVPLLIIGILVIGAILLGYFFLWPMLRKEKEVLPVELEEPTTTTTTIAYSPYPQISGPFQKSIVNVSISGDIVKEAIHEIALSEIASPNTFKVLIPKTHNDPLTNEEVILSLVPELPARLHPYLLARKYLIYTYYGEVNPSLGLIIDIGVENKEEVKSVFLSWEKNLGILKDLQSLFLISVPTKRDSKEFQETTNAGAEIRYFAYSGEEVAISYAFFDQYLVLTSSLESTNSAVSHLGGATEPIYP